MVFLVARVAEVAVWTLRLLVLGVLEHQTKVTLEETAIQEQAAVAAVAQVLRVQTLQQVLALTAEVV